MKFSITKSEIFPRLQNVVGVVERKASKEVMSNLLFDATDSQIQITGTDSEVELQTTIAATITDAGKFTAPARKLFDICKSMPDDVVLKFDFGEEKAILKAGKSRFTLATLSADDFPIADDLVDFVSVTLPQNHLATAINRTSFAMANQDARYYLNGLLFQIKDSELTCVGTDGHRLALSRAKVDGDVDDLSAIVPRKAIIELSRLIGDGTGDVTLKLSSNHMQVDIDDLQFTSRLIDGKYPDFERVIPDDTDNISVIDSKILKSALTRSSILANETYKGVRLTFEKNSLGIQANNPKSEEAIDEIEAEYSGNDVEIGFNVTYLLDALNAADVEFVSLKIKDGDSSLVINPDDQTTFIVMPVRL